MIWKCVAALCLATLIASPAWGKHHARSGLHGHRSHVHRGRDKSDNSAVGDRHGDRPFRLAGTALVDGKAFHFASGGHGWSIPYGTVPITPNDVGEWGSHHGAIGLNHGDDIPDPGGAKRPREGIEIHASDHWASSGCVVFAKEKFSEVKKLILGLIETAGQAWLHVGPGGIAITSDRTPPDETQEEHKTQKSDVADNADNEKQAKRHHVNKHIEHRHRRRYAHRITLPSTAYHGRSGTASRATFVS
jgi:hypothetical protein